MKRFISLLFIATSISFATTDGYENNDILISPEEAVKLIGEPNVMFVSGDSEDVYKLGHIKGSVEMYAHHLHHADTLGNLHCEPLFRCVDDAEEYIGSKGISNDTMVIAYDDYKGPNATGVYHFFLTYGHTNVKILNGGRNAIIELDPNKEAYDKVRKAYKKAKKAERKAKKAYKQAKKDLKNGEATEEEVAELKAKYNEAKKLKKDMRKEEEAAQEALLVVKGDEEVEAVEYHIDPAKIDTTHVATKAEVVHAMHDILENGDDSKYRIVDTRGMIEIIGERKMDNVARGGHVPGAKFLEWKHISDSDRKMSFRTADEMREVFKRFNISTDNTVYAYCQVGTGRSSEIITALQLLGAKDVKVFAGSWDAWGNDMNLPIKR
jgi:thiosulfate/3-mercaptopyruvate sulfurtransferase